MEDNLRRSIIFFLYIYKQSLLRTIQTKNLELKPNTAHGEDSFSYSGFAKANFFQYGEVISAVCNIYNIQIFKISEVKLSKILYMRAYNLMLNNGLGNIYQ